MEILKALLIVYGTIGLFNLLITMIVVFRPREENQHLSKLKEKWLVVWNTKVVGKIFGVLTILISIIWLIIGWPVGIRKGFKDLKNGKNEI